MVRTVGVILVGVSLLLTSCRSPKERTPADPVPELLKRPQLPRRGLVVSDFERLAHWLVSSDAGTVELKKDLSEVLWGRASAHIHFTPELPGPRSVTLLPAEPWVIRSPFDTILLWMSHQGVAGLRDDYHIRLRYRDAAGALGEWILPYSPSDDMQMLHLRIHEKIAAPVQVESLLWDLPATANGVQDLYLDSLSIYQEVLNSIPQATHYVRPHGYAPVFAPQRKNSVNLNFPTSANAFRPHTQEQKTLETVHRAEGNSYRFHYESKGMKVGYTVVPSAGFPTVHVSINGKEIPKLWQGAQVKTEEGIPELRFARLSDNHLDLQYTHGVQFQFSLHGKTLQMDMNSLRENVSELNLGTVSDGSEGLPRILYLPFFRVDEDTRWPVFTVKQDDQIFLVSCFPDWWNSMSSFYESEENLLSRNRVPLGRMKYERRWRGSRNMFRERLYFTVSDRLQEVLPTPAMPVAMYRNSSEELPANDPSELSSMNVMSISPLEKEWEDRLLARQGNGDWLEHPIAGFMLKSSLLDGLPLQRLFSFQPALRSNSLFVPGVGSFPPWRFMDYDVRSIGGANFTQTYAEVGGLLQQVEAEWGGGIVSRGGAEWFWAGLVSTLVSDFPLGLEELHPLLPQFSWWNIHPFSRVAGLGRLDDFSLPSDQQRDEDVLLNRALAFQVAYGAMGKISEIKNDAVRKKAERIQKTLRSHFTSSNVERIAYWDGKKFLDAGEAFARGVLVDSRLYIRLDSDTEIWVNGDLYSEWKIRVDGRELRLPPFGFAVRGNELFVLNLPRQEEQPELTLMETPDIRWVWSPEKEVEALSMRLQGSLFVQIQGNEELVLEIDQWKGKAVLSNEFLKIEDVGSVRGVLLDGTPAESLSFLPDGSQWILKCEGDLSRVWISKEIQARDLKFSP